MKVLVLGANGLIGSTIFRVLAEDTRLNVRGTIRSEYLKELFPSEVACRLLCGVDLLNTDQLLSLMNLEQPDVVVNAAGLTKHVAGSDDLMQALPMNALALPLLLPLLHPYHL